ncbi:MAG: AAA family ATPase [Candidatus Omnitrophica bacterium]|nr:AAA family ATPase [Candidatus Omnitrophota bacterium]
MYEKYYGLKILPFNITSNPGFFFESVSHKEALSCLLYGISSKTGLMLITGEVGTGKTTLCKTLISKLPPEIKTSFILNPCFSDVQLLCAIIEDFGLNLMKKNRLEIIKKLNEFLVDMNSKGNNAVLIVDEAQNLNSRQLEQIRLLSNLETSQDKLLQIILVGQPELKTKLEQFNLRQIRQRICVKYDILPLAQEEVRNYIEFRLKAAGESSIEILPESYGLIYEFSKGIPRLINALCDRALLYGFVKEKKIFDTEIFRACIEELK